MRILFFTVTLSTGIWSGAALASGTKDGSGSKNLKLKKATISEVKKTDKKKKAKGSFHVSDSTDIDFEAASIEGRMKAPMGFLLRGRNSNAMENMVKLRTNFSQEREDSKAGVIAISPATP